MMMTDAISLPVPVTPARGRFGLERRGEPVGWLRDLTGSYDSGLLVIAAVCNVAAFATLCIRHDREMEQAPLLNDTVPAPGNVAEIV